MMENQFGRVQSSQITLKTKCTFHCNPNGRCSSKMKTKASGMIQQSTQPHGEYCYNSASARPKTKLLKTQYKSLWRLTKGGSNIGLTPPWGKRLSNLRLRATNQLSDLASWQSRNINNLEARKQQPASLSISSSAEACFPQCGTQLYELVAVAMLNLLAKDSDGFLFWQLTTTAPSLIKRFRVSPPNKKPPNI